MGTTELLIVLLIGGLLLVVPVVAIVLSLVAFTKTRRLNEITARLNHIENYLRTISTVPKPVSAPSVEAAPNVPAGPAALVNAPEIRVPEVAVEPASLIPSNQKKDVAADEQPVGWETFIGQKAFGWVAVVLFLFSAAFFLRYAYQNNWIGPVGRVAIGELFGAGLIVAGVRYLHKGLTRFSTMLMSAGIVAVYLATYSAFGFYHLLPQRHAGFFLGVLILESMIAAVYCRSGVIGMISVIGGLLTPVLMQSEQDSYQSFFTYLAILNAGVAVAITLQRWTGVGSVAFCGTQFLFWSWYHANYHPEKFAWSLGFQMIVFAIYLAQALMSARRNTQSATGEDLVRFVANAIFGFVAFRALTQEGWGLWIGTAALVASMIYAAAGRLVLAWRPWDHRLLLTSLAVAVGFIAWAIPVQAEARWISIGWTVMGVFLWMFGLRVSSGFLRAMAAGLGCLAVGRLVMLDLPIYIRDPFIPVFNTTALPSLGVALLILGSVWRSDRYLPGLSRNEQTGIGVAGVTGMTLLWMILSLECHGYFVSRSMIGGDVELWRWRAQLALTVFWTVFAIVVMRAGFRFDRPRLRWFSMVLFGLTVLKLFIVDMANVQQIYRIVAFFILAVVLGIVARVYQRFHS